MQVFPESPGSTTPGSTTPGSTTLPIAAVEQQLCSLAGQIAAATCQFVELLAEFDRRRGWELPGIRSCSHWLSWRCGMDDRTAREYLRVAHALHGRPAARPTSSGTASSGAEPSGNTPLAPPSEDDGLPAIRQQFAAGRLSYSKVRALTRVATAVSDADLAEAALYSTAEQVERLVRGIRSCEREQEKLAEQGRGPQGLPGVRSPQKRTWRPYVQWRWTPEGRLAIWGRLDSEGGARFLAALAKAEAELNHTRSDDADQSDEAGSAEPEDGPGGSAEPEGSEPSISRPVIEGRPPSNAAPALVALADSMLAQGAPRFAPTAQVMVLAPLDDLQDALSEPREPGRPDDGEPTTVRRPVASSLPRPKPLPQWPGPARFVDGPPVEAALLRRLVDDGRLRTAVLAGDGRTLDLGRARRSPSRRQLEVLWLRDGGCAVSGCRRDRFLHVHHVVFWSRQGRTSLDNLVLLCGEHHRLLHDGHLKITALGRQRFAIRHADGTPWEQAPATSGDVTGLQKAAGHVHPDALTSRGLGDKLSRDAVATFLQRWDVAERRIA